MSGKKLDHLKNHFSKIRGIDVNIKKNYFLTYSDDNAVILDMNSWNVIRNMRAKGNIYTKVCFSPDGDSLFNGFNDGKVYQWRLSDNKLQMRFAFCEVCDFCISPDQLKLIGWNKKGEIFEWLTKDTSQVFRKFETIPSLSSILQLKIINSFFLILGNNGRLFLLNPEKSRIEGELALSIISFSISQDLLCLLTSKGTLQIFLYSKWQEWSLASRELKVRQGLEEDLAFTFIFNEQPAGQELFEDCDSQISLASSEDIIFTKLNKSPELPSRNTSNSKSFNASPACQHELFAKLFGKAGLDPHQSKVNHCKMKKILTVNGEYPQKFRPLIWRFMLQLPGNVDSFAGLYSRGTHPALVSYFKDFKKGGQNEFSRTERITSALCYWSSLLCHVDYLHQIVNAFVMIFPGDDLSCFELVMSLIFHWMQHWFEFFPDPPVVLIESIVNLLKFHDDSLFRHLNEKIDLDLAIWKVLRTFLNQVIEKNDWLKIMDHLFTDWQTPEKLLFMVTGYFLTFSNYLKKLKANEILDFFRKSRKINVKKFIEFVDDLSLNHGAPVVSFNSHLPICQGQYPLFTSYPRYKVQSKEELAEEIMEDMREKEEIRRYNISLNEKVKNIENKEKEFFQRAKSLGLCNEDIIEQYHSEIMLKRDSLVTFNH
jgi:hypothetical protein